MSHKVKTVIVELEHPIDSDDDYLVNEIADEHYGVGRELVYCEDCKHCGWMMEFETSYVIYKCAKHKCDTDPHRYCAWAERKTE